MNMKRISGTVRDKDVEFLDRQSENRSKALREVIHVARQHQMWSYLCGECDRRFEAAPDATTCSYCGSEEVEVDERE